MSPIGHTAISYFIKGSSRKVNIFILIIAANFIDLISIIYGILNIEHPGYVVWSHSLIMSATYSVLFFVLLSLIKKNITYGIVVGLCVFSHWILDFIVWTTVPVGLNNQVHIGLGLYKLFGFELDGVLSKIRFNGSTILVTLIEFAMLVIGILFFLSKKKKQSAN